MTSVRGVTQGVIGDAASPRAAEVRAAPSYGAPRPAGGAFVDSMAKAKATAPAPRMQPSALTRAHIFGCLERNVDRVCGDLKLTPKAADKMKGALTSVLQDHIDVQLQRRTKSA